MATEAQILSSLSPNVVVGDPVGPLDRNQRKNLRSFEYFLCKTNPILSAVGGLQMNISIFSQMDYENIANWTIGQNKPNSNPIKPNFQKAQMNVNLTLTKAYRKKDDFVVRINKANSNPISEMAKMNVNAFLQKDYENEPPSGPKKTKPKQSQFLQRPK